MKKHQKFLSIIFAVVIICCMNSCQTSSDLPTIQDNQTTQALTQAQTQAPQKQVIKLTKYNISDYLKIDYSFDNAVVEGSIPHKSGTCDFFVKLTPLKRGDFENVTIKLSFKGDRGWFDFNEEIIVPFNGQYEVTSKKSGGGMIVNQRPWYDLASMEVSGEFVMQ